MNFQHHIKLPGDAELVAATPILNENTVPPGLLQKHLAPKGKYACLIVEHGAVQFIWEDTGEVLDANPEHPIVIEPERFHHVKLTGPVQFRVEFYKVPAPVPTSDREAPRPGEAFL